tara:strand:- start:2178 stop:2987 length:810 start_codon:yes stop_codon:yes gene_type:complete
MSEKLKPVVNKIQEIFRQQLHDSQRITELLQFNVSVSFAILQDNIQLDAAVTLLNALQYFWLSDQQKKANLIVDLTAPGLSKIPTETQEVVNEFQIHDLAAKAAAKAAKAAAKAAAGAAAAANKSELRAAIGAFKRIMAATASVAVLTTYVDVAGLSRYIGPRVHMANRHLKELIGEMIHTGQDIWTPGKIWMENILSFERSVAQNVQAVIKCYTDLSADAPPPHSGDIPPHDEGTLQNWDDNTWDPTGPTGASNASTSSTLQKVSFRL